MKAKPLTQRLARAALDRQINATLDSLGAGRGALSVLLDAYRARGNDGR
jgi:hypothetical protein